MFIDPIYLIFIAPGLILGILAQIYLKLSYGNYSQVRAGSGMTGNEVANLINEKENFGVKFTVTPGTLNDYYNPINHTVNISEDNAKNMSVANIAVIAHEFGHVQQKLEGSNMMKIRSFILPTVNFGSGLGMVLIMVGLFLSIFELGQIGLILFSMTTIFSLITLPLEIDASIRGMKLIKKYNLVEDSKLGGAKSVLTAAAMTYFASLVQSIGQVAYYAFLLNNSNNRE